MSKLVAPLNAYTVRRRKKPTDDTSIDVYSHQVNSTCFGHHYARHDEIDSIKPRLVLAWMCWLRLCGVRTRAECTVWMQVFESNICIHTVRSAPVPTPHNRSQHIQANTRRGFIQSVLLTMGVMMPETCWVNLLWINIYTCVICWFFLLLSSYMFRFNHHHQGAYSLSLLKL